MTRTDQFAQTLRTVRKAVPTGVLLMLAAGAALYWYSLYTTRPWTRFGQVRAFVIEVAPRVSGRVVEIPVRDNQFVEAGSLLFRINPEPYELAVQRARTNLELARVEVATLEAMVGTAAAAVRQSEAAIKAAEGNVAAAEAAVVSAKSAVAERRAEVVVAERLIDQRTAQLAEGDREATRAQRLADRQAGSVEIAQSKAAAVEGFTAMFASAKAKLDQATASLVRSEADEAQAQANLTIAREELAEAISASATAKASLLEAEANLGQWGDENVRIKQAEVALANAELELSFTAVTAASDGYVTNLLVTNGTFANAGEPQLAFVSAKSFWVYGFFRETQLRHIKIGDPAVVTLMSHPDRPIGGVVESINQAIYPPNIATSEDLIPQIEPTFDWVRLAQRVPVRIRLDGRPEDLPLIVGTTASVAIRP